MDGVFFFIKWWIVHFSMAVSFVDVHVAHALVKKGAVVLSEVGVPFNILFFFFAMLVSCTTLSHTRRGE